MKSAFFGFLILLATGTALADDVSIRCQGGIQLGAELRADDGSMDGAVLSQSGQNLCDVQITQKGASIIASTADRQFVFNCHESDSGDGVGHTLKIYSLTQQLIETDHCSCDVD